MQEKSFPTDKETKTASEKTIGIDKDATKQEVSDREITKGKTSCEIKAVKKISTEKLKIKESKSRKIIEEKEEILEEILEKIDSPKKSSKVEVICEDTPEIENIGDIIYADNTTEYKSDMIEIEKSTKNIKDKNSIVECNIGKVERTIDIEIESRVDELLEGDDDEFSHQEVQDLKHKGMDE